MNLYNDCLSLLESKTAQTVYLGRSLIVKLSPHSFPIRIKIVFSKDGKLFVVDRDWNEIEVSAENSEVIANSIYQRLKIMGY